jgi:plasmid stabilization system protein ParE
MDAKPQPLRIVYAPSALAELDEIWNWNLERNGFNQAQAYLTFLRSEVDALGTDYERGREVSTRPELRYVTLRWSGRGHGHVVVYQIDLPRNRVIVAHVFHTRQNWEQHLKRARP